MVAVTVLAMMVTGSAQAKTNEYINCQVYIEWSTGTLALELSQSTWDLGSVPNGGLKDTWFGEATHGKFWVRNAGDTNAAIFITAEISTNGNTILPSTAVPPEPPFFAMAVATNVEAILPAWNVLDQSYVSHARVGRYMKVLMSGDYMLFDLRFYAGAGLPPNSDRTFRVGVYATSSESETP